MYSQGKKLLLAEQIKEKATVQPKQFTALTNEQIILLDQLLTKLQPIIKAKQEETQIKLQLTTQIKAVSDELAPLASVFAELAQRLEKLEELKSANAEQERVVLDRLLEVL